MKYDVRLVVRPGSTQDIETVLAELEELEEVARAEVIVDVRLVVEAETTEEASNLGLRLVERAATYANDVWLAETPRQGAGEAG
ncbi:MAG: hypothetical protein M3252_03255 [Actinomycetota bacterium]|nr:hypothetical protein [Actinomycetota bacterium]